MIDVTKLEKGVNVRYLGDDPNDIGVLTEGKLYGVSEVDSEGDARIIHDEGGEWYIGNLLENLDCFEIVDAVPTQSDAVHSPAHYTQGAVEVIDYIDQVAESYVGKDAYYAGNIIKYVSRAPHKNGVEDIRKARVYLSWLEESMDGDRYPHRD